MRHKAEGISEKFMLTRDNSLQFVCKALPFHRGALVMGEQAARSGGGGRTLVADDG